MQHGLLGLVGEEPPTLRRALRTRMRSGAEGSPGFPLRARARVRSAACCSDCSPRSSPRCCSLPPPPHSPHRQSDAPPLLPDLEQEAPSELIVTRAGDTFRLGFRSAVRNVGAGPLVIIGRRGDRSIDTMVADQGVTRAGAPSELVRGVGRLRYVVSPDHRHWHLLGFERYELARPDGRVVVNDRKTGFCLGDRYAVGRRHRRPLRVALRARAARAARHHAGDLGRVRRRLRAQPRGAVPPAQRPARRPLPAGASRQRRSRRA